MAEHELDPRPLVPQGEHGGHGSRVMSQDVLVTRAAPDLSDVREEVVGEVVEEL